MTTSTVDKWWLALLLVAGCDVADGGSGGARDQRLESDPHTARASADQHGEREAPLPDEHIDDVVTDVEEPGTPERCVNDPRDPQIRVRFACSEVSIRACKDLSNVVVELSDGTRQRFEGLSGHEAVFAATPEPQPASIVRVWVKAGSNASGDGPGYGERFEAPRDQCDAPATRSPEGERDDDVPDTDPPDESDVVEDDGIVV